MLSTIGVLLVSITVAYYWLSYRRMVNSFVDRRIQFPKPLPVFGNECAIIFRRSTFANTLNDVYQRYKRLGVFGFFDLHVPILVVTDPELIKQITIKDFDHFVDHRQFLPHADLEPLIAKSLFCLTGDRWRDMRTTLSPAFTGNKIRKMFHLVVECSQHFADVLRREAQGSRRPYVVEMKDLTKRFANDVIATTAFGIQVDSLQNRDNIFYEMALNTTELNRLVYHFKILLMFWFPQLCIWFGLRLFTSEQYRFYNRMVHDTIRYREQHGIHRPDMIQLLMDARSGFLSYESAKGEVDAEGFAATDEMGSEDLRGFQKRFWDDEDVTSQCYLFVFAGSENTSSLLSFAMYELMVNPEVQKRLLAEIDEAKAKLAGQSVTYDVLTGLLYLDMVISETLRKWPPTIFLDRQCTRDYTINMPDGRCIELNREDGIWIPVHAMQNDPDNYPQPERFDPERFSEERRHSIRPFTYLPLGAGPRNCIGSRFVLMEVKAFLFNLLTTFTLEVADATEIPVQIELGGCQLKPANVKVGLRPRS